MLVLKDGKALMIKVKLFKKGGLGTRKEPFAVLDSEDVPGAACIIEGYYRWRKGGDGKCMTENEALLWQIRLIHKSISTVKVAPG